MIKLALFYTTATTWIQVTVMPDSASITQSHVIYLSNNLSYYWHWSEGLPNIYSYMECKNNFSAAGVARHYIDDSVCNFVSQMNLQFH